MSERRKLDWFRVRDEAGLEALPHWIKGRKPRVNTYRLPMPDRNGNPVLMLGYDRKPDSDWGKFEGHTAAIWFASEELAEKSDPFVRKGLGWPVDEPAALPVPVREAL